jgi:hypothetical protein
MENYDLKKYFERQYPQDGVPDDYFITFEEYVKRNRELELKENTKQTPITMLFAIYDKRYRYSYDGDEIKMGDIVLVFEDITSKKLHYIAERNLEKLNESHEYVGIDGNSVIPKFKTIKK